MENITAAGTAVQDARTGLRASGQRQQEGSGQGTEEDCVVTIYCYYYYYY